MSMDIVLVAPEEEWSKALLEEYYTYLQEKKTSIRPKKDWPQAKETPGYKFGVEYLDKTLLIAEQIQRDVFDAAGPNKIYSLFDSGSSERIIYNSKIEDLIDLFRNAKSFLIKNGQSKKKTELQIEAGPVALCEFALKHDYGVRLSE